MKEIKIETKMQLCQMDELSAEQQMLVNKAKEATANSYSPYSKFRVGAALKLANGEVVTGANQENASYPVGLCGERVALFAAQAQQPGQPVKTIAIAARNERGFTQEPVSPCGMCRQAIMEVEDRYKQPIEILLYGEDGIFVVRSIADLLPLYFVGDALK